jgi:pimeloyl-ACP methyl ester carboxylesterase
MNRRDFLVALLAAAVAGYARPANALTFPANFQSRTISNNGVDIFVRVGGAGPAVVLIHGFTQSGDGWASLAVELAKTHTVIVPDLRGLGRSGVATSGFDKKTQASDIRQVLDVLGIRTAAIVGHDIGLMVAYAFAAQFPDRTERLAILEAPLPGVAPWEEILKNRVVWHFGFTSSYAERLVDGRERVYLDRFWDEFSANPGAMTEAMRVHYTAQYARSGAMKAGFANFAAFGQDAIDNAAFQRTKLTVPVLAVGGEKSFGPAMEMIARNIAGNVTGAVVQGAGHWLMEEKEPETMKLLVDFLRR